MLYLQQISQQKGKYVHEGGFAVPMRENLKKLREKINDGQKKIEIIKKTEK